MHYTRQFTHKTDLTAVAVDLLMFYLLFELVEDFSAAQLISFLCGAIIYHYLKYREMQSSLENERRLWLLQKAIWVALLLLFLRCGLMAWLTLQIHIPPEIAIIIAAVLAGFINTKASAIFVFEPKNMKEISKREWQVSIKVFIGYVLLLKFFYLGLPEILHEEGYYWNYGQHLALGYLDHPPMVGWIIWLSTTLLGDSEFATRLGPFLLWFIGAFFVYKLAKKIFDTEVALNALLLYALLPYFFGVSFVALPDSSLVTCWAGALYYFYRLLIDENPMACIGVGIFIGMGLLSKYTIVLLGAAAFFFIVTDCQGRKWLLRRQVYISIAIAIVIFSPVIIWNAGNEWSSFSFQGPRRVAGDFNFNLFHLIGSILVLITPTGFMVSWAMVSNAKSFFLVKIENNSDRTNRTYKLFILLAGLPLSVFLFFSFFRQTKLIWTGPIWLALLPFMAKMMSPEALYFKNWMPVYGYRPWRNTAIILMLTYGATFNYLVLGFPGIPYPLNLLGLGWRELSSQIEDKVNFIERKIGKRPLVVSMDKGRINSWLAFYRGRSNPMTTGRRTNTGAYETGGRHLFGKDSNMYLYWFPNENQDGKTMILVGRKPEDLVGPNIETRIKYGKAVEKIEIKRKGSIILRKYYRIVEGYHHQ
jgi:dolichol-phosphate mannosyltransferase